VQGEMGCGHDWTRDAGQGRWELSS
jgi:hypothetical protein